MPAPQENPRRRRRRRRARRNPSVTTWVLIAGATAVAVGIGATIAIQRRRGNLPPGVDDGADGGGGGGGGGLHLNYVPYLKNYPHKDRFGNERAFGIFLRTMGYNPGPVEDADWSVIDQQGLVAVAAFQRDFNAVRALDLTPASAELSTDGLIGPATANAFWVAEQWMINSDNTWQELKVLAAQVS